MRYIAKTNRCAAFDNFVQQQAPTSWENKKFRKSPVKLLLHTHLLAEQQHLCVYCQQSIPRKTRKDDYSSSPHTIHPSHIEHVRPKELGKFPNLTFEYTNLSVSCNGYEIDAVAVSTPNFCGHPKDNDFDDALFLHPFEEPDIEVFFEYDINGKIKPSAKNPARANYAIQLLGLDYETLREMRERQYDVILEDLNSGALDINLYLDPTQPELPKFFSMLRQLFGF